jgi:succinate dehydrogenase / fumarate reductase, cytochrome b subunit
MSAALTLTRSTIGQKALIAVTGLVLFGFVIGHFLGNLILFAGPEAFNDYAWTLKNNAPLLWGTRLVLLVSVVTHIYLTLKLAKRNSSARPSPYKKAREDQVTSYAARTMVITGPLLLAYILFHLAHFTAPGLDLGALHDHVNVYGNVIAGFRVWWVSAIYVFANAMLGLHLFHGAWSALQSIGAQHPRYDKVRRGAAVGLAMLVAGGNIFIPIAVQAHLVGSPAQLARAEAHARSLRAEAGMIDEADFEADALEADALGFDAD